MLSICGFQPLTFTCGERNGSAARQRHGEGCMSRLNPAPLVTFRPPGVGLRCARMTQYLHVVRVRIGLHGLGLPLALGLGFFWRWWRWMPQSPPHRARRRGCPRSRPLRRRQATTDRAFPSPGYFTRVWRSRFRSALTSFANGFVSLHPAKILSCGYWLAHIRAARSFPDLQKMPARISFHSVQNVFDASLLAVQRLIASLGAKIRPRLDLEAAPATGGPTAPTGAVQLVQPAVYRSIKFGTQ